MYNPSIIDYESDSGSESESESGSKSGYSSTHDQMDSIQSAELIHFSGSTEYGSPYSGTISPTLGGCRVRNPYSDSIAQWQAAIRATLPEPAREHLTNQFETPQSESDLGKALQFHETRQTHVVMVSSLDRDQQAFPSPTQIRLKLPRIYKNVERIDIVQVKFFCGLYAITAARGNAYFVIGDQYGDHVIAVSDGTYDMAQLIASLNATFASVLEYSCVATYSPTTGRVTIAAAEQFTLYFLSYVSPPSKGTAYSEWGLGWVLGWGGQPTDLSGATSYTADHFPRLVDDYIYVQLNDTGRMNEVDHTDVEINSKTQDSTGQVSHYFGKLLLNSFGCWAQTFIEAPKTFQPVLGRLDRLDFTWTDRHGNALTGPDAASCDWHMALRITEIADAPLPTRTQPLSR